MPFPMASRHTKGLVGRPLRNSKERSGDVRTMGPGHASGRNRPSNPEKTQRPSRKSHGGPWAKLPRGVRTTEPARRVFFLMLCFGYIMSKPSLFRFPRGRAAEDENRAHMRRRREGVSKEMGTKRGGPGMRRRRHGPDDFHPFPTCGNYWRYVGVHIRRPWPLIFFCFNVKFA